MNEYHQKINCCVNDCRYNENGKTCGKNCISICFGECECTCCDSYVGKDE